MCIPTRYPLFKRSMNAWKVTPIAGTICFCLANRREEWVGFVAHGGQPEKPRRQGCRAATRERIEQPHFIAWSARLHSNEGLHKFR